MLRFMLPFLFETPGGGSGGGGEGGEGGGEPPAPAENGLYAEALGKVPEELRPYVEEQFKGWDANVTPKLQEAAKLREQFGPLAEIEGLSDVPPEELSSLIEFRNMVAGVDEDPTAFIEWLNNANEAMGLTPGELDEDAWTALGEEKGWFEGGDGEPAGDPRVDELMTEREQFRQWMEQQEAEKAQAEAQRQVEEQRREMEAKLAEAVKASGLTDEQAKEDYAQSVIEMAHAFADDEDPIGRAVERIKQLRGGVEGERADRDLGQPDPALSGGRADTSPQEFTSFDDPKLREAAKARLKT